MRIGIDVATLSLKRIVERIVLISGDTDMIPAIKLARREGLQVILVRVGSQKLSHDLTEDCDIIRAIKPKGRCDLGNPLPAAASNGHVSP